MVNADHLWKYSFAVSATLSWMDPNACSTSCSRSEFFKRLKSLRKCLATATKASRGQGWNQSRVHPDINPGNLKDRWRNFSPTCKEKNIVLYSVRWTNGIIFWMYGWETKSDVKMLSDARHEVFHDIFVCKIALRELALHYWCQFRYNFTLLVAIKQIGDHAWVTIYSFALKEFIKIRHGIIYQKKERCLSIQGKPLPWHLGRWK